VRAQAAEPVPGLLAYWGMLAAGEFDRMLPLEAHKDRNLELLCLMLHRHAYHPDAVFLKRAVLPLAQELLDGYDKNYLLGPGGRLLIDTPKAVNPMPEVAGLRDVLDRMVWHLDQTLTRDLREQVHQMRGELPPVPVSNEESPTARLLPAIETLAPPEGAPELSAIFPFRIYGAGKEEIDMARHTFNARRPGALDPVYAAYAGLAPEAVKSFQGEFTPAHALALQAMLLQGDYGRIHLFPAWPKEWDVDFRLHAPPGTVIEASLRKGRIEKLRITPSYRARDLIRHPPQLTQQR